MRSAPSRTLEKLCGSKPPLETWLPSLALLMPQVQWHYRQRCVVRALIGHTLNCLSCPSRQLQALSPINRYDSAPVHPGRCRSRLLGDPDSCQVRLQELWEHSDAGEPRDDALIKMLHSGEDKCQNIQINLLSPLLQSRDYISKAQVGQSMDGVAEVISRLRFSSDEGTKYSGDLMAIMEILKNTTELYKATKLRLSSADVAVNWNLHIKITKSVILSSWKIVCDEAGFGFFLHLCLRFVFHRTTSRPSATYWRRNIVTNGKKHNWYVIRGCV